MDISAQTRSLNTPQSQTPPVPDAAVAKTYLTGFVEAHPEWQTALVEAGIKSDATYLRHETRLTPRCRAALGYYRMVALAGGVDQDDPIRIAKAAPPWLQSRTLAEENLAVRACNTLAGAGLVTIGDLSHVGWLSEIKGLGQVGVRDITALFQSLLRLEEGGNEQRYLNLCGFDEVIDSPGFWAAIEVGLTRSYTRESNILRKRLALDGERWTLQDTANLFNVTRERVRQIEAAALRRITANRNWSRFINDKLNALLAHRAGPVSLADAAQRDSWFAGIASRASRVAAIPLVLEYLLQSDVKMLTIEETHYLGYLSPEDWHVARTTAIERLTEAQSRDDAPVLDDAACSALAGAALPDNAKEFINLLWLDIKPAFQFGTDAAGRDVLLVAGTSTSAKVMAILEQARAPLHYSEIARQIDERSSNTIDVRVAHNVAASVGLLLGQGIYGLEKHLPYDAETRSRILQACEAVVRDGPAGRIWHVEEILKALLGEQPLVLGDIDLSALTNYTLNIIMKKSQAMLDLGRFTWQEVSGASAAPDNPVQLGHQPKSSVTSPDDGGAIPPPAKISRGNLNALITEILEKAGHPLPIQELRARVREHRGTRDEMLIHQGETIIRVGPKLWGINDRDSLIKRPDQPALIERVREHLSRTRKGVKLSEVCALFDVPPGCPPEIVFSLALTDPRFRVGPGRYLMLKEWDGPGRLTVLQAVQQVLLNAARSLPLDKINEQVNELMGEDIPRRGISTLLRAAGGELLDDGRWRDGKRGVPGRKRPVRGSSSPATGDEAA